VRCRSGIQKTLVGNKIEQFIFSCCSSDDQLMRYINQFYTRLILIQTLFDSGFGESVTKFLIVPLRPNIQFILNPISARVAIVSGTPLPLPLSSFFYQYLLFSFLFLLSFPALSTYDKGIA
jgi:hypothetical protein